ncbi:magnesium transporter [Anaerovorax odorimutans]|uniref:Magnesium transporter MgtE n=1 Tax=Anaerovorax odorimutans TaxID=109327 RepID=A0ABT1RTK4_9FIRM|nr:magnesium transporter [Anaerovorax odorimutans]MCQ4638540.1 magnesium transporter [Anaerovorax odorimutans]
MDNEKDFDLVIEEILESIENKQYIRARDELLKNNEVDIAEILEEVLEKLDVESTIIVFRMLPKDVAVEVFSYLPSEDQVEIIHGITDREISYIIKELDFDDKIDVLEELPANLVDKILEKTPKEERKLINTFLNYPENSAGSLMTPDYISLQDNMTVGEALAYIKKEGMDSETVYTCYVKEKGRKLEGIVSLRSLVINDEDVKISELMGTDYVYVNVYDDQEEVSEAFKKYGFLAIPVVDKEHRLVGIITVDDILDVIEEETTEDIERMAGVMDDSDTEYLDMSVLRHVRNRLPWLFILMCSYIITGGIIGSFEATLSQVICLVAYMPMLMGTGGNSGSQSATLIIRSLALDDIDFSDIGRVIWKEFRVSLIIGIVLSTLNFIRICWLEPGGAGTGPGPGGWGYGPMIATTVCGSMLLIVIAAKIIGSVLPMVAKRIGIDPALMATPMISSLTDMVSVVTYMLLATALVL